VRRAPFSRAVALIAVLTALAATGCGSSAGSGSDRVVHVLAASSLSGPFEELAETFERDHPGVDVRLILDSSATLAIQVVEGAPGDVLATADERTMQRAVDGGATLDQPVLFATNRLVVVVPNGNPAGITTLADLDDPSVDYVACVPSAPCGYLARGVLAAGSVDRDPRSLEVDVKAVLQKVVLDEADAGLVYTSDAVAAGADVESFPLPDGAGGRTAYPMAPLSQTEDPRLARAWVDLVRSDRGQRALAAAGFSPAP
jgi:molybdate transport system substrate-binding protein